jgi:hypothetical protein
MSYPTNYTELTFCATRKSRQLLVIQQSCVSWKNLRENRLPKFYMVGFLSGTRPKPH